MRAGIADPQAGLALVGVVLTWIAAPFSILFGIVGSTVVLCGAHAGPSLLCAPLTPAALLEPAIESEFGGGSIESV